MNFYNFQGINGCLTIIIIMFVFAILFRLFAGFMILTLPFWIVIALIYAAKKLYDNYILGKNNKFENDNNYNENMRDEGFESDMTGSKINRDAEDVDFKEYKE